MISTCFAKILNAPDWKALHQMGAAGFLVKPVDPDSLIALVRRTAVPHPGTSGTFRQRHG